MNKFVWIIGLVVLLSCFSVYADGRSDSINVFQASIVEQTPPTLPAIALEQRSDARVKLFLSVSPVVLGNVDYYIEDLYVTLYRADSSGLIRSVSTDRAINVEDVSYDNFLNPFDEQLVIANVNLGRTRTGREIRIVRDETAEKICAGEMNETVNMSALIPDELNLTMKVGIKFKACRGGEFIEEEKKHTYEWKNIRYTDDGIVINGKGVFNYYFTQGNDKHFIGYSTGEGDIYDNDGKKIGYIDESNNDFVIFKMEVGECTGILMDQRSFRNTADLDYADIKLRECLGRIDDNLNMDGDKRLEETEKCYKIAGYGGLFTGTIIDYIYVDAVIGVDKTNLDMLVGPEELKSQICRTLEWRKELDKWIESVSKVKEYFNSACLLSVLGAAGSWIFGANACDSMDWISLGCDWIFCPSEYCNGMDPMNSIITASTMCWDMKRGFFNKELGFNLKNPDMITGDKVTYTRPTDKGQYVSSFCNHTKPDHEPRLRFPHYACITGVEGNLEKIDQMILKYQECLIQARVGGISIGWCDKLRSYFLCDRVLGEVLEFTSAAGAQGLLGKAFGFILGPPLELIIPGNAQTYYSGRGQAASDLLDLSLARYDNVPFIQLLGKEKQFIKNQVCNAFIQGNLFSLEDMKQSLDLLETDYPDSAFVITEVRPWSRYVHKDGSIVTSEYSYDVFFQIYNGEKSAYAGSGYYSVFLRDLSGAECRYRGEGTIQIANGAVKQGEMIQGNEFKIHECSAAEQCLRFKGQVICSPIGQILSFATNRPYDPLGLTIFDKNDENENGISDNWEWKYFGLEKLDGPKHKTYTDSDEDGYCNVEEFEAGTDPTNPRSHPTYAPDKSICDKARQAVYQRSQSGAAQPGTITNQPWTPVAGTGTGGGAQPSSVQLLAVLINDQAVSLNDPAVSNGGKHKITFRFSEPVLNCQIDDDVFNNINSDECIKEDLMIFGDGEYVTINADGFSGISFEIRNEEQDVDNNHLYVICKFTTGSGNNVYSYINEAGRRCSDYKLVDNLGVGKYGQFVDHDCSGPTCVQSYFTAPDPDLESYEITNSNYFEKSWDW